MEKNKENNHAYICRANITPTSDANYDFEAVAIPLENGQIQYSCENEEYFNQILLTAPENIDITRVANGLPIFDNHPWDTNAKNILGITTDFNFDERGLIVKCKLGARADEALRSDIKNGILKNVSIEGFVQKYEIVRNNGEIPQYKAIRWQPTSLSIAPIPNDIGASITVVRAIKKQIEKESGEKSSINNLISKF